ncbi:hypothetical protein [[Pseudomonas] boreopolis]|uniref:Uncharacterized protein n=1 Tax=Xanthomonas boreopolis TaxID=86183 RepID=A0A919F7X6_9XANT|nr:hypothetical protein GCM10009090_16490 [[Pseudomonas] boreopolis]
MTVNILTTLESKYEGATRPGHIQLTFAAVDGGEPRIITTVPAADAEDLVVGAKYRFAPELVPEST